MAKSSAAKNTSLQLPPLCGHDRKAYWWAWHETPTLHVAAVDVAVYFRRLFCRLSPQQQQQQAEACNVCEFVYCNCLQSDRGRGSLSGPLFVGLHTLPTSLGSMPAKRLARLSSPASAYLDIIRSAALQPRTLTICVFNLPHAAAAANVLKIMQHAGMCGSLQFATRSDVKMSKSFTVRRLLIRAAEVAVRRRGAATATKTAAMATLATAAAATNFVATCNSGNWLSNMQCTVS